MAKLTTKARKHIAAKNFAGPDRSYPIEDASHARNALARVSQHGSSDLKARVRAKVHAKYPGIGHASQPHPETNPGDYDDSAHKGEGHDRPHTEFRPEGHKETAVATAHKDMAAGVGMQPAMHFESFPNRPAAHNAHGVGHSHGQRAGDLRLSGVKGAHRIGKR